MKRSPLKRKTALRVNHRSRKPSKTKHARRPRAFDYMAWTSRQVCIVARAGLVLHRASSSPRYDVPAIVAKHLACEGPIQVDHAGNRFTDGDGKRAFDRTCIPLCRKHHEQRTNAGGTLGQAGIFYGFTAEMVRTWSNAAIEIHQQLARAAGVKIPDC